MSLNYAVGGTDPLGYHLVNLALLVVSSLEVYLLGRELLLRYVTSMPTTWALRRNVTVPPSTRGSNPG